MTSVTLLNATHQYSQRGLSLIELMIALALSLLLILGLVEIFGSARAAFGASEGLSRTQENSRFALEMLRRDTRMAGHLGCLNEFEQIADPSGVKLEHHLLGSVGAALTTASEPMRIDVPLQVHEFTGTAPGNSYAIASATPAPATSTGDWTPALPAGLGLIAANILPGSDVLVLRYLDAVSVPLLTQGLTGGVNQATGSVGVGVAGIGQVVRNGVYGITNCKIASLFQITGVNVATGFAASAGGRNLDRGSGIFWSAEENYGVGADMYRYRVVVYFVARGAGGNPSLFRMTLPEAPGSSLAGVSFAPAEEIIEGVDMMQVLLGAAAASATTDLRVDDVASYASADALLAGAATPAAVATALGRATSVRISLLMRSPTAGSGENPTAPTVVVGDVAVTPPQDLRIREVYDALVLLRNRHSS